MKKGKWSLQVTIILLVCAVVALSLLVTNLLISNTVSQSVEDSQAEKAGNVARMMAHSPLVIDALSGSGSKEEVQRFANEIKSSTNVQFVVIMDMKGIRLSHPDSDMVGKKFVGGDERGVLQGKEYVSVSEGTLGRSLRSFTPIFDSSGKEVGAAAVGISLDNVNEAVGKSRSNLYIGTIFGLLAGIAGAVFLARYIKKSYLVLNPLPLLSSFKREVPSCNLSVKE